MKEFFDQVWLDNTVKSYAIVLAIILAVFIFRKPISYYISTVLFKLLKNVWGEKDKEYFINLVVGPLSHFLTIMVCIVTLDKLNFPKALNFELYNITAQQMLNSVGTALFIGSFFWFLMRIVDFISIVLSRKADLTDQISDNQLIVFFRDFIKVIICIIGIILIARFAFGFNVSSFLTGLSIVGAAIALALRESLENLIASFIIFFDKPFSAGDTVKVNNVSGMVENIGLRSTRIRTEQKTYVTVPNKQMVDSVLDNLSLRTQRKGEINLELALSTSIEKIKILTENSEKSLLLKEVDSVKAHLAEIKNYSYTFHIEYFTNPVSGDAFNDIVQTINLKLLTLLKDEDIELAGINLTNFTGNMKESKI